MRLLLITLWRYFRRWPHLVVLYTASSIAMIALWVVDPLLAQYVIDNVGLLINQELGHAQFAQLFALWIGLSIVLSLVQAAHKMVCWRILNYTYCAFQADSFNHILHMDVIQHISRRSGAIIKKIDNAADQLWDLGFQIFQVIIPSIIAGVIFLGLAYTVNPKMTAIVATLLVVYALVLLFVTSKAHPQQSAISRIWVGILGRAYDVAQNILPAKSAPGESRELQRVKYWNARGLALQNRTDYYWGILEGVNMFMLLRALVVGLGIYAIGRGEISLGQLFFFLFIIFRLVAPIEVIGSFLPKWNEKIEKVRMGVKMSSLPSIVKNPKNGKRISDLKGEVTFKDVSFSYDESNPEPPTDEDLQEDDEVDVLDPRVDIHDTDAISHRTPLPEPVRRSTRRSLDDQVQHAITELNLTIAPGEHIALVGHSGAGKSTVAALVNRFFDVTGGAILIDSVDIRECDLHWLRGQIGLVLQDSSMFNDSIMENIRYTKPSASDAEVMDAAKRASAHEFVMEMPEQYRTGIGERGVRLSGGERQRIAIARAILKRPKIVVLDEATSALDSKTEKAVQEGISELISNRTAMIIAHRLSTVRSCDRIAVLDKGALIACAPHETLMETCPLYAEMVKLQSHGMLAE